MDCFTHVQERNLKLDRFVTLMIPKPIDNFKANFLEVKNMFEAEIVFVSGHKGYSPVEGRVPLLSLGDLGCNQIVHISFIIVFRCLVCKLTRDVQIIGQNVQIFTIKT